MKTIIIIDNGKTYAVGSEKGFQKLLETLQTPSLKRLGTHERVSSFASLVSGATYYKHDSTVDKQKVSFIDGMIQGTCQLWLEGQYDKAKVACQLVLKHQTDFFGTCNHPDIVTTYIHLANLAALQGDLVAALQYYQQALNIALTVFGVHHSQVAEIYIASGHVLVQSNCPMDAWNMYKCALQIQAKLYGNQSEAAAACWSHCGKALEQLGRHKDAIQAHQTALDIMLAMEKKVSSSGNQYLIKVAQILCNIASTLNRQGKLEQAQEHYYKALAIQQASMCRPEQQPSSNNSNIKRKRKYPGSAGCVVFPVVSCFNGACWIVLVGGQFIHLSM